VRRPPSPAFLDPPGYARHRPERTLLYQLVEQHYPAFRELRAAADRPLPNWWRSAARSAGSVPPAAEVYRTISRHLIGKAGLTRATGATGAVTLVQRFGSALNLNVHFHMVFLDGAYQTVGVAAPVFRPVAAPRAGQKLFTLQTVAPRLQGLEAEPNGAARAGGLSLKSLCASSHAST
jgi:hypothetical protein